MFVHPVEGEIIPDGVKYYKRKEIGCLSWASREGDIIPIKIKMEDEEGEVQTFDKIRVCRKDKKRCIGTTIREFECELIINGLKVVVLLVNYSTEQKWYLVEKEKK